MNKIAIQVRGLGKRYRLGVGDNGKMYSYKSLRDTFGGFTRRPLQTLRSTIFRQPMNEVNSFWALNDVSFEVQKGEVIGIIGRNGAGKSTLLKILSRITKPTTGVVNLFGRVGSLLEVGTGFHPELSGRENIYLNGAILGMTRAEVRSRFAKIVDFSEIAEFINLPVKQYSSGMYMRLAFAVAAHLEPEILIVDEVLAVGDMNFQNKCLGRMKDVAREGRTVLFVSHNMGAVRELCSRGCLLNKGAVEKVGAIDDIISRYMHTATNATEVEAIDVPEKSFVGPARIIRCGVEQQESYGNVGFDAAKAIRIYADIEHKVGAAVSFGIRIKTSIGTELLHLTSQDDVEELSLPTANARLMIRVPPIPYNDGDYLVTFYLGDRSFQLQHLLTDAVCFRIDNSGLGQKHASGPLRCTSEWSWQTVP